jgi:hypothetical protein
MIEAEFSLKADSNGIACQISGTPLELVTLLVFACRNASDVELLLQETLDNLRKMKADEDTSTLS